MNSEPFEAAANRRLEALKQYEIMDTPPEAAFDDITLLASYICEAPISLITILDKRRQWFKSKRGLRASETPIEQAFCAYAILQTEPLIVNDATLDNRFATNPLVTEAPHIRFYAGAPLVSPEGVPLGTLCVIDSLARELSDRQREALVALSRQATAQLDLRRSLRLITRALTEKQAALDELTQLQSILPICAWCKKIRDEDDCWHEIERYITEHSLTQFTHGVCPECSEAFFGKEPLADKRGPSLEG